MVMKKIVSVIASLALITSILSGCSNSTEVTDEDNLSESNGEGFSIGLVTDEGGINDKSFNQSANEGAERATEEFGLNYITIESQKKEDYVPNLQALVDEGCRLTFGIGVHIADDLKKVADMNPDNDFCIVDAITEGDNILSITFREEEGSFVMGVIAGKMTKTNKVGFIGGRDSETVKKFESGFAAGVKSVNPTAAEGLVSTDGKSAGSTVKYVDTFTDTNKGYEAAKSLYEAGCDVIYHAAGGAGIGLFQAAKELKDGGTEVWAIGVDMDQAKSLPEYSDVILTSMLKNVNNAVYKAIKDEKDGVFQSGNLVLGIGEDGLGIAESTSVNTPQEVIDEANVFVEKINNHEFIVPSTREEVVEFSIQ